MSVTDRGVSSRKVAVDSLTPLPVGEAGLLDLPSDEALMSGVRRTVGADVHPPAAWRTTALSAAAWLAVDHDFAPSVFDSTGDEGRGFSGLRSAGTVLRQLTFVADDREVQVEMALTTDQIRVLGQLVPAEAAAVRVLGPEVVKATVADDRGMFRFDGLPVAPFSINVLGALTLKTGWIMP